ncbi:hypothetical protein N9C41_01300 [Candidatus Marinimicrobia bacterium]|nr:hypothetical protein [Candidatus Neomarinimicrobiota bacterium]
MATIIDCGLATRQNIRFGINHKYITKTLTPYNYRWYAIVRKGWYVFIVKGKIKEKSKTTFQYRVCSYFCENDRHSILDYTSLHQALDDVNDLYDGEEGEYPPEVDNSWVTFTIPDKTKKPWAYQFNSFREDEE